MPTDKTVTKQVEFRRVYTFKGSAELDMQQFKTHQGPVADSAPRMRDYSIVLNSLDSVNLVDSEGTTSRPTLVIKATVTGDDTNITQWLDEIDKRHTVHTEVSSSAQLRKHHQDQKAAKNVHNAPKA